MIKKEWLIPLPRLRLSTPKPTKAETIKALKKGYKTRNKDGKLVDISNQDLADRLGMGVEKLKKYLSEAGKEEKKQEVENK